MIHLITGHNNLRYHLYNCGESDSYMCRLCDEDVEITIHLTDFCPYLWRRRMEHLKTEKITDSDTQWGIEGILEFFNTPALDSLLGHYYTENNHG